MSTALRWNAGRHGSAGHPPVEDRSVSLRGRPAAVPCAAAEPTLNAPLWSSDATGMGLSIPTIVFLAVAFFVIASHIRIVRDGERLVVHRLGRFYGLRGPGLVLKLHVETVGRLALGTRGEALNAESARFGSTEAPISSSERIGSGSIVRVVGFTDNHAEVVLDSNQTRSFVCASCGHHNVL